MRTDESFGEIARESPPGTLMELWQFLGSTKKWWLFPVIVLVLLLGLLIFLSATPLAPFIYTIF